jgi:phytoene dehydrogenase-like protein
VETVTVIRHPETGDWYATEGSFEELLRALVREEYSLTIEYRADVERYIIETGADWGVGPTLDTAMRYCYGAAHNPPEGDR